jgi:hypothetical protein
MESQTHGSITTGTGCCCILRRESVQVVELRQGRDMRVMGGFPMPVWSGFYRGGAGAPGAWLEPLLWEIVLFPSRSRLLDRARGTHRHEIVPAMSPTESHIPRPVTAKFLQCAPCSTEAQHQSQLQSQYQSRQGRSAVPTRHPRAVATRIAPARRTRCPRVLSSPTGPVRRGTSSATRTSRVARHFRNLGQLHLHVSRVRQKFPGSFPRAVASTPAWNRCRNRVRAPSRGSRVRRRGTGALRFPALNPPAWRMLLPSRGASPRDG